MSNHTNGHFKKKDNHIHEFLFTKYPFSLYILLKYFIYFHGQQSNKKKKQKTK